MWLHRGGDRDPQLGRPGGCRPHQGLRRALPHGSARQRALRGGVLKEPTCPVGPPRQGAPGGHLPAPPVDERRGGDRGFRSPAWAERGVPSDGSPRHGAPAGAPHAADAGARARSLPSAGAGRRWGRLGVAGRAEGRGLLPGLERLHDVAGHENAPVALRDVPAERAADPERPGARLRLRERRRLRADRGDGDPPHAQGSGRSGHPRPHRQPPALWRGGHVLLRLGGHLPAAAQSARPGPRGGHALAHLPDGR
mmetsp:Transcript_25205/g.65844  ORF Transcript_25205/g.65844 Transcript_25205/m.65844 type:complete len:253 (+) Transcript_25205:292-1050(+)